MNYDENEIQKDIFNKKLSADDYHIIDNLNKTDENLLNYEKKIYVRGISRDKNVCNNNLVLLILYLKNNGFDLTLFKKENFDYAYYLANPLHWTSIKTNLWLFDYVEKIYGTANPRIFEKIAQTAAQYDTNVSLLNALTGLVSIRFIYEQAPLFNRNFNCDRTIQCISTEKKGKKISIIYIMKYFDNFTDYIDFKHEFWGGGIFSSIARKKGYDNSTINYHYYSHDLLVILKKMAEHYQFNLLVKGHYIYINDQLYAKKVILLKEPVKCHYSWMYHLFRVLRLINIYIPDYKDIYTTEAKDIDNYNEAEINQLISNKKGIIAYQMIKDLYNNKGDILLKEGELFNLPYTKIELQVNLKKSKLMQKKQDLLDNKRTLQQQLTSLREKYLEIEEIKAKLEKSNQLMEEKIQARTRELEKANHELSLADQQKSYFLANLAHEMKTPLTLAYNYFDRIYQRYRQDREFQIAMQELQRLKKYIVDFFDIQKIELQKQIYQHDNIVLLNQFMIVKIAAFKLYAEMKGVKIKYISHDEKDEYCIKIDSSALDRILNNLLDNAVKYNKKNGLIEITLSADTEKIILEIKDTGVGIETIHLDHIFDPYYQISQEKLNYQGIGMGLSIVKKIISETGGDIRVSSIKGEGTAFTLIFNRITSAKILRQPFNTDRYAQFKPFNSYNNETISQTQVTADSNQKRYDLLIIEDNPMMLNYLYSVFCTDYQVHPAKNGLEAMEKLKNIQMPDLIISDIMMDGMDGYEFYDNLIKTEIFKSIPFIFLTAKGEDEKIIGLKKGAVDYIQKPFQESELKARVESLLSIQTSYKLKILKEMADYIHLKKGAKETLQNDFEQKCSRFQLSASEKEVVSLLCQGLSRKEIAAQLVKSEITVKNHLNHIYRKCGVKSALELNNLLMSRSIK